jgi:anti-sigma factor ChrR (cupin superfamily)
MSNVFDVFDFRNQDAMSQSPFVVRATDPNEWTPSPGVAGFSEKTLYRDAATKTRVLLMKVEPGAYAPTHSHEEVEHVYVLSGSFSDEYGTYEAGDYLVRNPKAAHEARSEAGATVLLFYSSS